MHLKEMHIITFEPQRKLKQSKTFPVVPFRALQMDRLPLHLCDIQWRSINTDVKAPKKF